jgi:hypothetical protein
MALNIVKGKGGKFTVTDDNGSREVSAEEALNLMSAENERLAALAAAGKRERAKPEGFERFDIEGTKLHIVVDLSQPSGVTKGGNPRYASTIGNFPVDFNGKKIMCGVNVYGKS